MTFPEFVDLVPKIKKATLPGESAHAKMSPPERLEKMRAVDFSIVRPRQAAVLALVYPENDQAAIALIERNAYEGVHSSQIAFPGGKVEPGDLSPLATALRETREEIGVFARSVTFVREMSRVYIPPSNFSVQPFLAYAGQKPRFVPDSREVASILSFPIGGLLDDETVSVRTMATSYSQSIKVPTFKVGKHTVWGATAMMLSELKEVLRTASQARTIS
jgi:8-oxo-dGTP pyrophosphatase MutT (NUDIX family)